jgi:hypothetical protein
MAFISLRIGTSGRFQALLKAVNFVTCPTTSFPRTLLNRITLLFFFFNFVGWNEPKSS